MKSLEYENCSLIIHEKCSWGTSYILWKEEPESFKIQGVMNCQNNDLGWEVFQVAAEEGFGPWLYISALIDKKHLIPCQEENKITESASHVWEYFYDQDIEYESLESSPHYQEHLKKVYYCDDLIMDYQQEIPYSNSNFFNNEEYSSIIALSENYIDDAMSNCYN